MAGADRADRSRGSLHRSARFLAVGPQWLLLAVVGLLAVSLVFSHRTGMNSLNQALGICVNVTVTVALVISLVLLVTTLPSRKESPLLLMRSAALLWISNVLVFALWYWRLDAGGPNHRDRRGQHTGAFLFPQMTLCAQFRARSLEHRLAQGLGTWL